MMRNEDIMQMFYSFFFFQYNIVGITYVFVTFYTSEPFSSQTGGYYYVNIIIKVTFSKYIFSTEQRNEQTENIVYRLIYNMA